MFKCLDEEERRILRTATEEFFMGAESSASEHGRGRAGLRPKAPEELRKAWLELFQRRRREQPDDTLLLTDERANARIFTRWMDEWIKENLRADQLTRARSRQTSIFSAYLKRVYGGKYFVMALLETGFDWSPSLQQVRSDPLGATEHVGKHFCVWLKALLEAIRNHKMQPDTMESRRRSGDTKGQHGLTPQEVADREERNRARRNLHETIQLAKQVSAGRGWWTLSEEEKWWLQPYWDGHLARRLRDAQAKLSPVQAPPFHMWRGVA